MARNNIDIEIRTKGDGTGARKVDDALEEAESSAKKLRAQLDQIEGLDPQVRAQIESIAGAMDRAAASGGRMAQAKDMVAKKTGNAGMAALEFSRAVEDVQYGIGGLLNNIPPLLGHLGVSAGLAGVVSLAAVGLTQLVKQLASADEETAKLAKTLETARSQIDDFYEEAGRDGTAAFRANLLAVVDVLEMQNSALLDNLKLTREKRAAELRVAAAGSDLELATIAGREASGEMSGAQADAARRALEVRRLRTAAEEKVLQAEEAWQLQQELRAENARQQLELDERLARAKEVELALIEERNKLQSKQESAERLRESGQNKLDESGFFSPQKKGDGRSEVSRSQIMFSESDRERLTQLERVILPQQQELTGTLESTLQAREKEQGELSRAQGAAFNTLKITEETEGQILELNTATIETQAKTEGLKASAAELKTGLDNLKDSAGGLEEMNAFQKASLEAGLTSIQQVAADGVVTAEEFSRASGDLRRFQTMFGASNREFAETVTIMQEVMRKQQREISALKENARRISNNSGG